LLLAPTAEAFRRTGVTPTPRSRSCLRLGWVALTAPVITNDIYVAEDARMVRSAGAVVGSMVRSPTVKIPNCITLTPR